MKTIGIIGSGLMGSGIAQVCASAGYIVKLIDINDQSLNKGIGSIKKSLGKLSEKGKISSDDLDNTLSRIVTSTNYLDLKNADIVIEAATENYDLKIKILKEICEIVPTSTVLATNTSSISITDLAGKISHPERFIGIHFFNPVPLMTLVEIIKGLETSESTYQVAQSLITQINKHPITVKNSPGFAVNRILIPMLNEAFFVLAEGLASPEDIDAGMVLGCNHPIGPLALADLVGLDTLLSATEVFYKNFGDSKYRPCPLLREMVAAGYLGRKSGRGVYVYQ